jgi:hypothetical protein
MEEEEEDQRPKDDHISDEDIQEYVRRYISPTSLDEWSKRMGLESHPVVRSWRSRIVHEEEQRDKCSPLPDRVIDLYGRGIKNLFSLENLAQSCNIVEHPIVQERRAQLFIEALMDQHRPDPVPYTSFQPSTQEGSPEVGEPSAEGGSWMRISPPVGMP